MPPPLTTELESGLSTDVKYLFRIAKAVSEGFCSVEVANMKPGLINHSRWLTKANRILRLYVTTSSPTTNLKDLATYIMKVYVPMYFNVKYYSSVIYGSILLSKFIRSTQYLPENQRKIVNRVVQNNSYFAHCENVLLAMLFDDKKTVRESALKKILYIRDNLHDPTKLREYNKPAINFESTDYINLINLDNDENLSEPPFTANIPYEYLVSYIELDSPPLSDPEIPCHIQGTERYVQLLTSVSHRVVQNNRDDVMTVTAESRKLLPRIESKQDLRWENVF